MWPTLTGHLECRGYEFVVIIVATESFDDFIAAPESRMIMTIAVAGTSVYHLDHVWFGVTHGGFVKPIFNGLSGFIDIKVVEPIGGVGSPKQTAEIE